MLNLSYALEPPKEFLNIPTQGKGQTNDISVLGVRFFFFKLSKWFQSETKVENHCIEYKSTRSAVYMWLCFSFIGYVPESESH